MTISTPPTSSGTGWPSAAAQTTTSGQLADLRRLGTVLTVWAHPDDEAYLAGGLLAALGDLGARVVCVTATRGGVGRPARHPR